jgi:Ca-activated chloride channel family protein
MSSFALTGIVIVLAVTGLTYLIASARGRRQRGYRRAIPAWKRHLPIALLVGAIACVVLAVVQFRVDTEAVQGTVVLTMDASNSMDGTDVKPSRFEAAQDAARTFLGSLPPGFPVGLVAFGSEADVVVTPTDDRTQVEVALPGLPRSKGTVIGDGLNATLEVLEEDRRVNGDRPAAVVLLSDGLDTGSEVPPLIAADRAAALGIPVYTVVLGDPEAPKGPDASLLAEIAGRTGGTTSTALTAAELKAVYETLGSQLSTDLEVGGSGPLFIVLGVLLAVGATVVVLLSGKSQY